MAMITMEMKLGPGSPDLAINRRMKIMVPAFCFLFVLLIVSAGLADTKSYGLKPELVAPGTYVFTGSTQHFSPDNGGNIVNTGFIVTDDGVVVIDTGPSAGYGHEMRTAIRRITTLPILKVIITHHHPDHFLGNQAFSGIPIWALPETISAIQAEGNAMAENLYRLVGDWMLGTEVVTPEKKINLSSDVIGGHRLRYIPLQGHDTVDLAVLDETTGTLFAGDLVFMDRAPTTPHADIPLWLESLKELQDLEYRLLIPGHGSAVRDRRSINQTRDYLVWLEARLKQAAQEGLEMTEVMELPIAERFSNLASVAEEYQRSVHHLWPGIVQKTLPLAEDRRTD